MTRSWRIVIGVAVLGGVGLAFWQGGKRREPVYEGRPLSSWLDHHVASSAAVPEYGSAGWKKADEALRAIGTNGIPVLLEMLRAKDPPRIVMEVAARQSWKDLMPGAAVRRHEEAQYAFSVLGTNAASAVPELIRIYDKEISESSHMYAAISLGNIGRPAQAALPALMRRFTHTNQDVRFYAVSAAANIGGDPSVIVPAMVSALKDPLVHVRWNALHGLILMGPKARAAVPEILKMVNDPGMSGSSPITNQVYAALWRIAPEKAGKPLVIEEQTPGIRDGLTVEPIKAELFGERKVLIPAGKKVPAVGQYWNSDPRPKVTFYRGDHLLGHFEVVGVPARESVNISTLCILAEGKIFLTARNNDGYKILQLRRIEE